MALVAEADRALRQPPPDGKLTLGSDPASTLCLDDPDVSRQHAQLVVSYGQVTVTPTNSKVTLAGSWGISILDAADSEADFKTKNWLASGGLYYQATKSLKVVGEFNYAVTDDDIDGNEKNKEIAPSVGLMLFF